MSSKLLALVEHLRKLKHDDKVVVFSQFLGMLDLIEHQLKIEKLVYVRMEGSTSHK
jgi:SNF2 family DNA or RNA helicase